MQNPSPPKEIQVLCRSSHIYADRPVAVVFSGERHEVIETISQRRTPEGPEFHVLVDDGRSFILTYIEGADTWNALEV